MHTAKYFIQELEESNLKKQSVFYLNLVNDSFFERLITPKIALTASEYFAFEREFNVLVILTDMCSYADCLRAIYCPYDPFSKKYCHNLSSEMASIFERAGCVEGKIGSITLLPIVTMPNDNIEHPVPDITGTYNKESRIFQ